MSRPPATDWHLPSTGIGWMTLLATVCLAAYLGLYILAPAGRDGARLLSAFGTVPLIVLMLAAAMLVARVPDRPRIRLAGRCLVLAMSINLVGTVLLGAELLDGGPMTPSVFDLAFFAFYPPTIIGALLISAEQREFGTSSARAWLSALIVLIGGGAVLFDIVIDPVLAAMPTMPLLEIAASLVTPVGDLLILGALGVIVGRNPGASWRSTPGLLTITLPIFLAGDISFSVTRLAGDPTAAGPANYLLPLGWWLAVLVFRSIIVDPRPNSRPVRLPLGRILTVLALATGYGMLIDAISDGHNIGPIAIMAIALTVVVQIMQALDERARRRAEAALRIERDVHAQRVEHDAHHDPVTGLPNGVALRQALESLLRRSEPVSPVALLTVDLTRFREINATFGFATGDTVLVAVGRRLESATRAIDFVARLAGDDFALLLDDCDQDAAETIAARVRSLMERPFSIDGQRIGLSCRMGLAIAERDNGDPDRLIRRAESALHAAKGSNTQLVVYEHGLDGRGDTRSATRLAELRAALTRDELVVHFMPYRERRSRAITCAEALVRWQHPTEGLLQPAAFLPLAESAGLMAAIDRYVLDAALRQAAAWDAAGTPIRVAVNASRDSVRDPEFPTLIATALDQYGLPAAALEVEITEEAAFATHELGARFVAMMAGTGVRLMIDDFGTGYSSLARLRDLAVAGIKIDRGFVTNSVTNPRDAAIVEATVALAVRLNLDVVAEGVEDQATLDYLDDVGVDFAQGYFVGRPAPAAAIDNRLARAA